MTVAFTNLTSGTNNAGVSSVATASVTLTANRLALMTIVSIEFDGSAGAVPTCSGWTLVDSFEAYSGLGSHIPSLTITVLRRMAGSDATGAHTIDFASNTQTEIAWSIDESDANVDTTGTNGSGAIVQTAQGSAASATSVSATLAAFGSADNGTFGGVGSFGGGMTAWTVGSGFTALANYAGGFSTDLSELTEYRTDNDTTVDATTNSTIDGIGIIAIEVKAAAAGGYTLTADSGSYTLTGQSANLLFGRVVVAEQGSYALNGQDTTFSYNIAVILNAEFGQYTLVGSSALVDLSMNAEQGSYALTGQDVAFNFDQIFNYSITAEQGSYNLTGQDVAFNLARLLTAGFGQYTLTGRVVGLNYSGNVFPPSHGSVGITMSMRIGM